MDFISNFYNTQHNGSFGSKKKIAPWVQALPQLPIFYQWEGQENKVLSPEIDKPKAEQSISDETEMFGKGYFRGVLPKQKNVIQRHCTQLIVSDGEEATAVATGSCCSV